MEVRMRFMIHVHISQIDYEISSEGVQVGNVRSKFGVLGSWTTVLHDREDPVGMCPEQRSFLYFFF